MKATYPYCNIGTATKVLVMGVGVSLIISDCPILFKDFHKGSVSEEKHRWPETVKD